MITGDIFMTFGVQIIQRASPCPDWASSWIYEPVWTEMDITRADGEGPGVMAYLATVSTAILDRACQSRNPIYSLLAAHAR